MRPWDALRRALDADRADPATAEARLAEVAREAGLDLDPTPRGAAERPDRGQPDEPAERGHDHGDGLPHDHVHPHERSGPADRPLTGIVGAGAVGTALGVALSRAGWPIVAVASRDPDRRARFGRLVGGTRAFSEPNALLDETELIILAVPDDALEPLARGLRLYSGQALVHTSGSLGPEVLEPAMAAGTQVGSFHPLVAFADLERAVAALHGATVAVEGDDQLVALLGEMAATIGATAVRLAPGSKAAYHAAAVLAAGGFTALLDAIAELGRIAGLDEAGALAIYGPLVEQTLGNARAIGIRAALTGPMTRGDVGTLERHLEALRTHAPDVLDLYRAAGEREIALAEARGTLTPETAARLRAALAGPG